MMQRHLALWTLCGSLALGGCAAPVVLLTAGAAAGAGTVLYDQRSIRTIYQDQQITHQIAGQLKHDPLLDGCHFSVVSLNHAVLLVGQAQTPAQKAKAYALAKKTPMVKRIYNQITVSGNLSGMATANDSLITGKVKTALLGKHGLRSAQIKVLTENGIVYLMGVVTHQQGSMAAQEASRIIGVQKVIQLFEYVH